VTRRSNLFALSLAVSLVFALGFILGMITIDSVTKYTACKSACVRDGSKIYQQAGDLCTCIDMRTMRIGPNSSLFRRAP
jgi:hypothetical protein